MPVLEGSTTPPQPKVMHVIARLNVGGAARYVIELLSHLKALGYETQLVCGVVGKHEGDMRYLADEYGLDVTIIPSLGREISPVGDILTIYRLWRLIRREKPDIVHTHTAKAGLVGRVAARLCRVPVVVHTFHGHVFAGYFGKTKTRVFLLLERLMARFSTRIITLSAALKRELAQIYRIAPENCIEVIELGFDLDKLLALERQSGTLRQSPFRQAYGIPADTPLVGIVGRLVPIKNHDLFLRAARIVVDTLPGVWFAIVGDGERRAELEALTAALRLMDQVRFCGWATDLLPVYAALDMLVLCSDNEGLPVSLIEAMAGGVPVVATNVGGVSDLLEGGDGTPGKIGQIVPPGDANALAEAILNTLKDERAHERAIAARQSVARRYGIAHSAALTDALYKRLLPHPLSPSPKLRERGNP